MRHVCKFKKDLKTIPYASGGGGSEQNACLVHESFGAPYVPKMGTSGALSGPWESKILGLTIVFPWRIAKLGRGRVSPFSPRPLKHGEYFEQSHLQTPLASGCCYSERCRPVCSPHLPVPLRFKGWGRRYCWANGQPPFPPSPSQK